MAGKASFSGQLIQIFLTGCRQNFPSLINEVTDSLLRNIRIRHNPFQFITGNTHPCDTGAVSYTHLEGVRNYGSKGTGYGIQESKNGDGCDCIQYNRLYTGRACGKMCIRDRDGHFRGPQVKTGGFQACLNAGNTKQLPVKMLQIGRADMH